MSSVTEPRVENAPWSAPSQYCIQTVMKSSRYRSKTSPAAAPSSVMSTVKMGSVGAAGIAVALSAPPSMYCTSGPTKPGSMRGRDGSIQATLPGLTGRAEGCRVMATSAPVVGCWTACVQGQMPRLMAPT